MTVIRELVADGGMAVIVVEQHAQLALALTRQAIVLERGRVVHRAASESLLRDPDTLHRLWPSHERARAVESARRKRVRRSPSSAPDPSGLLARPAAAARRNRQRDRRARRPATTCSAASAPACSSRARSRCSTRPASARGCIARASCTRHRDRLGGGRHRIDFEALTGGKSVVVYGQTESDARPDGRARAAGGADHRLRGRRRRACTASTATHPARALRARRRDARARVRLHRRLRRLPRRLPRRACRPARSRPTSASIRSAGSACCPTRRRCPTSSSTSTTSAASRCAACAATRAAATTCSARSPSESRTGRTSGSGTSCGAASTRDAARRARRPARRSRRASRRCAASSPSRCASAGCSSPATRRTSCRRPAPRA